MATLFLHAKLTYMDAKAPFTETHFMVGSSFNLQSFNKFLFKVLKENWSI